MWQSLLASVVLQWHGSPEGAQYQLTPTRPEPGGLSCKHLQGRVKGSSRHSCQQLPPHSLPRPLPSPLPSPSPFSHYLSEELVRPSLLLQDSLLVLVQRQVLWHLVVCRPLRPAHLAAGTAGTVDQSAHGTQPADWLGLGLWFGWRGLWRGGRLTDTVCLWVIVGHEGLGSGSYPPRLQGRLLAMAGWYVVGHPSHRGLELVPLWLVLVPLMLVLGLVWARAWSLVLGR